MPLPGILWKPSTLPLFVAPVVACSFDCPEKFYISKQANEDHNCYTFDMRKLKSALCVHMDHVSAVYGALEFNSAFDYGWSFFSISVWRWTTRRLVANSSLVVTIELFAFSLRTRVALVRFTTLSECRGTLIGSLELHVFPDNYRVFCSQNFHSQIQRRCQIRVVWQ
jgi:hypothetical protein